MAVSLQGHSVMFETPRGVMGRFLITERRQMSHLTSKQGKVEDPGKYRPVSLTLLSEKVMEQIIPVGLEAISKHNMFGESSRN